MHAWKANVHINLHTVITYITDKKVIVLHCNDGGLSFPKLWFRHIYNDCEHIGLTAL